VDTVTVNALIAWVERGEQPGSLVAPGAGARTVLLCPYPKVAVFEGKTNGAKVRDVNDATNWSCSNTFKQPEALVDR
jgi:hypothetical protein